jgi:hypothetical protein
MMGKRYDRSLSFRAFGQDLVYETLPLGGSISVWKRQPSLPEGEPVD